MHRNPLMNFPFFFLFFLKDTSLAKKKDDWNIIELQGSGASRRCYKVSAVMPDSNVAHLKEYQATELFNYFDGMNVDGWIDCFVSW